MNILVISILGTISLCFGIYSWFAQDNRRRKAKLAAKSKKHKKQSRRRSDRKRLSKSQRAELSTAVAAIKSGDVATGADIIKKTGMMREVIDVFLDCGYVKEAALSMHHYGLSDRAANLYALHGYWEDAAECFRHAGKPIDEANCYRSNQDFIRAAALYEENGRLVDAAHCYQLGDKLEKALEIYIDLHFFSDANQTFEKLLKIKKNNEQFEMSENTLRVLQEGLGEGKVIGKLANFLVHSKLHVDSLHKLLESNSLERATELVYLIPKAQYEILLHSAPELIKEKLAYVILKSENIPISEILERHVLQLINNQKKFAPANYAQETKTNVVASYSAKKPNSNEAKHGRVEVGQAWLQESKPKQSEAFDQEVQVCSNIPIPIKGTYRH